VEELNPEQLDAVKSTEGYVRVVAGAGSGKTRALAHRFAYLVQRLGVMPSHILCVTFSCKSANEMRVRIRKLTGDNDTGYVNTFHGFCASILKEDGSAVGYPKNFPVLDNSDIDTILREIYDERGLTMRDVTFAKARDMFEVRKTIKEPGYCREMANWPLERLKKRYDEATLVGDILFYGYLYYEKKCFALDYNDLIMFALMIFDDKPDIRAKWQQRLEYVMVDEFQDIDALQYELMTILTGHHHNLFVVGDPDQTIYTWRGANVKFLLDFDKSFPNTKTILMNRNYRSTPEILAVANSLISKNKERIRKNLIPVKDSGPRVLCRLNVKQGEEATWMASKMGELHKQGVPYSKMAVLYRAHYVTREVEMALQRAEIPYAIYSGVQFYDRAEVKDALSFLRLTYTGDDLAFLRVCNKPKRNLGMRRIAFLKERAAENGSTLYETLKTSLEADIFKGTKAKELVELVERHRSATEKTSEMLTALIDESGYEKMLRTEGAQARLDNLAELESSVTQFETTCGEECGVGEYLAHVALFTSQDVETEKTDRVRLMTIHTAKGLEFPYVFLCSLNEGLFPARKTSTKQQMEEERRLAFVAMTRAEDALYLTTNGGKSFDGFPRYPSRFLLDIDPATFDYETPPRKDLLDAVRVKVDSENCHEVSGEIIAVGTTVEHDVFGRGIVQQADCDKGSCLVKFDNVATARWIATSVLRTT